MSDSASKMLLWTVSICALVLLSIDPAKAREGSSPGEFTVIVNGKAKPNTRSAPNHPAFISWCGSDCVPSTQMPMKDADGGVRGFVYTWAKPFEFSKDNKTFCFNEFVEFAMKDGSIYAASGTRGSCGAVLEPSMRPATHSGPTGVLIAAGGDGKVLGGTHRFKNWVGTFTDRLYVELNAEDGISYYDQLFWKVSAYGPSNGWK